jgi:hypothetical protein
MKHQTLYGHRAVENIVAASQVPHSAALVQRLGWLGVRGWRDGWRVCLSRPLVLGAMLNV